MSGIPGGRKGKSRPVPAGSILRPEDVALKPKPSITNKRPVKSLAGSGSALPAKKIRLDFGSGVGASSSTSSTQSTAAPLPVPTVATALTATRPPLDSTWREFCQATVVDVATFSETLRTALTQEKTNKVARLITAVMRLFVDRKADSHRFAMEYHMIMEVCVAVKERGHCFTNPYLQKCLVNMLCVMRPMSAERQDIIASLNVCLAQKLPTLDNCYITGYIFDSLGDRHWVDKSSCSHLVGLVLKPYGTSFPPRELYYACNAELYEPEHVPPSDVPIKFTTDPNLSQDALMNLVLEYLRKWWEKGNESPPRNLLRTMCSFAGIPEVRFAAARKLDTWIQNGKLQKNAMELLLFVAANFGDASTSQQDSETLSLLLKMRSLKSKQVQSVFSVALPIILNAAKDNVRMAIRLIIANEFGPSQHRYPMNFALLQTILQMDADNTTRVFAEELSAMVVSREEYCKPSRLFTRELIRSIMKSDFNFSLFADGYFQRIWDEAERSELGIEDHVLKSAAEVITMMPIVVSIIPHVREAFANRRSSPLNETTPVISKFEKDLISYYTVCLRWLPRFKNLVEYDEYRALYHKIMFLEKSEYYTTMDQGPSEAEFAHCYKVFGECRLTDSVIWQLVGEQFHTLSQYDVIDVIFSLTKRAVHCRIATENDLPLIMFSSQHPAVKLLERMLKVSLFKNNNPNELPPIYITSLYSRVWVIAIMWICIGKPTEVLSEVCKMYPIFRLFLHMIMTGDFSFPQSFENMSAEHIATRDRQLRTLEEETIVLEERKMDTAQRGMPSHINRDNSALCKTCSMPFPVLEIRLPSDTFLNDLRLIATECRIAANLCQSRSPDLLHNLIQNYGVEKAIPAIREFLATTKGAIESLPLAVLSQFLLFYLAGKEKSIDEEKFSSIVAHIRKSIDSDKSGDAILVLLEGLAHQSTDVRAAALKALNYVFKSTGDTQTAFPLSSVELLTGFKSRVALVCKHLVNAAVYEADPSRCIEYLDFIFKYLDHIVEDSGTGLHEVASSLALLNDKVGDDSELAGRIIKILYYYIEPCGSISKTRTQPKWPVNGIENAKEYVVTTKGIEYSVSSVAVETAISLVCRFKSEEWLLFRDEIVKKWITRKGAAISVKCEGTKVDIFNDSIRSLMLSSIDENIVKVALSDVCGAAALQMLCTFGLTTYAAGALLNSVDLISADEIDRAKIVAAVPFVRAYRYKGCEAGAKFLQMASGLMGKDTTMKMETEDQDVVEVAPVPRSVSLKITDKLLTKAEVINYLRGVTNPDDSTLFKCTPILQSAYMDENIAMVVIDHLENNLKFFLENHRAFLNLLMAASYCSDKYPAVRERVTGLSSRLIKSTSVHSSVNGFLKMFVGQNDNKLEKKRETASKNIAAMSADAILDSLNKLATVSHIDRARYLNAFLAKRPEIIDSTKEVYFLERQILAIFCGRNGVEGLVSQLPLRCSTDTLTKVLKKILQSFNPKLNPRLVVDFLLYCTSEVYTPRLSAGQLIVLSTYLAELVIREPDEIGVSVSLVDKMVDAAGFEILLPVGNVLVSMERSDLPREKRLHVSSLLRAIQQEFPCLKVADMANFVFLSGTNWRMKDADKNLTAVLSMLFENKYESPAVSSSIESMNQILINHPDVLTREFGVFSNLLSKMVTVDARTARMINYRSIITLFRDCCEKLLPNLIAKDLNHVDTAIQLLIAIFERYFKNTQNEKMISETILLIVSYYLENHVTKARELLFDQLVPIEGFCRMHPELQCTIAIKDNIRLINSEFC